MCGRYAITLPPEAVRRWFQYREQPNFPARYNIAPMQPVPVVTEAEGERRFTLMRWGFLPGFVKELKSFPLVINVRSETVLEKAAFRNAFRRRRCLMPADGFYEWQKLGSAKGKPRSRAFLLRRPDRGLFAFAAIHETWSGADGSEIDTVALLNTHANGLMSAIHERCPVVLDRTQYDLWLDPAKPDAALTLLRPPPDDFLEMVPIGPLVNKVTNDGPEVQEALAEAVPAPPPEPDPDAQADLF